MSNSDIPAPGTADPAVDTAAPTASTAAPVDPGPSSESPAPASPAPKPRPAARPARAEGAATAATGTTPGTLPRWADRRQAAPLAKIGMIVFSIGLVSIAVALILFATGRDNLPLWINLVSLLAPIGLAIGLLGVFKEARAASPALVARRLDKEAAKAKAAGDPSEEWNLPDLAGGPSSTVTQSDH